MEESDHHSPSLPFLPSVTAPTPSPGPSPQASPPPPVPSSSTRIKPINNLDAVAAATAAAPPSLAARLSPRGSSSSPIPTASSPPKASSSTGRPRASSLSTKSYRNFQDVGEDSEIDYSDDETSPDTSGYAGGPLALSTTPADIIKLNIGGHRFDTTAQTLLSIPDTFFSTLLSGRFATATDEDGALFIDRDGQYFAPILTFLRTRRVVIPTTMTVSDIRREAKYFAIEPLVKRLSTAPVVSGFGMKAQKAAAGPKEAFTLYIAEHGESIDDLLTEAIGEGIMEITVSNPYQAIELSSPSFVDKGKSCLQVPLLSVPSTLWSMLKFWFGKHEGIRVVSEGPTSFTISLEDVFVQAAAAL